MPAAGHRAEARVPPERRGERLDQFLVSLCAQAERGSPAQGLSRSRLRSLIDAGHVHIDGRPARAGERLRGGEQVVLVVPAPVPLELAPEAIPLEVLYEDDDLIAIAKPADLVVHPGAGRRTGTLVNALLAHCRDLSGIGGAVRPGIVHRLDRGTSGVLVVAKNDRAHESLAGQFRRREVEKRYVAFVLGAPRMAQATLDTPYGRHPVDRKRFTSKLEAARRAVTSYRVVASRGGVTELDVLLGTGRTHQIRVHLSEHGHPVVGDLVYGGRQWARVTDATLRAACKELTRQALHAARLVVKHPQSGETLVLEAPLPPELAQLRALVRGSRP